MATDGSHLFSLESWPESGPGLLVWIRIKLWLEGTEKKADWGWRLPNLPFFAPQIDPEGPYLQPFVLNQSGNSSKNSPSMKRTILAPLVFGPTLWRR